MESTDMLVVTVELRSAKTSQQKELGRLVIYNIGGDEKFGNYACAVGEADQDPLEIAEHPRRRGYVGGHSRGAPVWRLVAKALQQLGFE
jgi:hypothetical protein